MDYNAVNAKIQVMKCSLLTKQQYEVLCQSQSVRHFLSQIRERATLEEELARVRLFLRNTLDRRILSLQGEKDYIRAWPYIKSLPNDTNNRNRQVISCIKGTEIDLHNIMRIYRLKRYYCNAEVYSHLIPICYKLNREIIKQMAESHGTASLTEVVRHTPYGSISFKNPQQAISIEMGRVFSKLTKRYPRSMAMVMDYFFAKSLEERNIIAVREGVKYHLSQRDILDYLRLH